MELLENIILGLAIVWLIWYPFNLRRKVLKTQVIFPFSILAWFLFIGFTAIVILFGLSPFHLIWMYVVSLVVGFGLLIFAPMQMVAIFFVGLFAMTGQMSDDDGVELIEHEPESKWRKRKHRKRRRRRR